MYDSSLHEDNEGSDSSGSDSSSDSDSDEEKPQEISSPQVVNGYLVKFPMLQDTPYIPPTVPQPITHSPPSARLARPDFTRLFEGDSDADADGESDGNATDDEYVPTSDSSSTASSKRRRVSTLNQPIAKRPRASPPSRNAPAPSIFSPSSSASSSPASSASFLPMSGPRGGTNPWACPYCTWVQHNHRSPDLKRHIRTHERGIGPPRWICSGVPCEEAPQLDPTIHGRIVNGRLVVGGCGKTFSRRDALKRHLDNGNIGCLGSARDALE